MHYDTFLFDLDGTLIDSNKHVIHCFKHAWQTVLNKSISDEEIIKTFGIPLDTAIHGLMPTHSKQLLATYRKESANRGDIDISMIDNAKIVLQELSDNKAKIAIITSKKQENAMHSLKKYNLYEYIDLFVGPESTPLHKPHPEPILYALEKLNALKSSSLMIGDSPYDLIAAQKAGVDTCAVGFTAFSINKLLECNPTYLIENLQDLLKFIK